MADSADRGKRSLIVMVLAFLITGGGVFVFLIFQSLEDMQDVKFRSFGSGMTGRASLPILKYFGFVDKETVAEAASAERKLAREDKFGAASSDAEAAAAPADAPAVRSGGPQRGGSPSSSSVPRMASSMSGPRAGSGGGSKSFSSFQRSDSGPALKLSGGGSGAGPAAAKSGKTMEALVAARGHLSGALNTGSALAAKGKWDQSFGLKHSGTGTGGQIASYNKAAATLDEIESGEVSSLKMDDPRSMAVPDVGKPKPVPTSESMADKLKEAAKKNPNDLVANALLNNIPSTSGNSPASSGEGGGDPGAPEMPDDMKKYILDNGVLEGDRQFTSTPVKCEKNCPGDLKEGDYYWNVTFTGTGQDGNPYSETCTVYSQSSGGFQGKCL
ncbi:MAG TPA: hypothetical protein PK523_02610 [Elusimicrobiales bacterium]|nr:hypothetical protein [Elusimicrobiales bacterium]